MSADGGTADADAEAVAAAADRLYRAECALHTARQAHIDSWITAAYERLHTAVTEHTAAVHQFHHDPLDLTGRCCTPVGAVDGVTIVCPAVALPSTGKCLRCSLALTAAEVTALIAAHTTPTTGATP